VHHVAGELLISNRCDSKPIDLCINAVIPSPSELAPNGPLIALQRDGVIRGPNGFGGVDVTRCGAACDSESNPVHGLAVIGRATEGCVLGNDTLSRKLHSQPEQWADAVVERLLNCNAPLFADKELAR
ncbi:MAG: hypothetical protein H6821_16055, partial [Planctomycetaceae bacterium]|nr:hypothetical protein [Planctomycetaceae bacterium]